MATSGSFLGTTSCDSEYVRNSLTFLVEWQRNSVDLVNVTSNVTIYGSVQSSRSDVYPWNKKSKPTVMLSVGGNTVSPSIQYIDTRDKVKCVFVSWTGNVKHNTDGTLSLPILLSFELPGDSVSLNSGYAAGTAELDRLQVNTVPILSHSGRVIGEKLGITLNRMSDSYTHDLSYELYGKEYVIASGVGRYHEWTISDDLIDRITDAPSAEIKVKCATYLGGSKIGETAEASFTAKVPQNEGTLPFINVEISPDNGELPDGFNSLEESYIRGITRINIDPSGSEAKRGARVCAISWTMIAENGLNVNGGSKRYDSYTGALSAMDVGYLDASGRIGIKVTVEDSRGFQATDTKEILVTNYKVPFIKGYGNEASAVITRGLIDEDKLPVRSTAAQGLYVRVGKGCYLSGNTCSLKIELAEFNNGNTGEYKTIASDVCGKESDLNNILAVFDSYTLDRLKLYSVRLTVTDLLSKSGEYYYVVPAASCTIHEGSGGKNVTVGGFCDYSEEHTFRSAWKAIFDNGIYGTLSQHQYIADVYAFALDCQIGFTPFSTKQSTANVPPTSGYNYSSGFVCKRTDKQINVILFGYSTCDLAINTYLDGEWQGWKYIHATST